MDPDANEFYEVLETMAVVCKLREKAVDLVEDIYSAHTEEKLEYLDKIRFATNLDESHKVPDTDMFDAKKQIKLCEKAIKSNLNVMLLMKIQDRKKKCSISALVDSI